MSLWLFHPEKSSCSTGMPNYEAPFPPTIDLASNLCLDSLSLGLSNVSLDPRGGEGRRQTIVTVIS